MRSGSGKACGDEAEGGLWRGATLSGTGANRGSCGSAVSGGRARSVLTATGAIWSGEWTAQQGGALWAGGIGMRWDMLSLQLRLPA